MGKYIHALSDEERFWEYVEPEPNTGCWLWSGIVGGREHYGRFQRSGFPSSGSHGQVPAHRYAYELLAGPIPEGLTIDHLCRTRLCVNPAHLEPVSHRENILRGEGPSAKNARKVRCPAGHPYDEANTTFQTRRTGRTQRVCRQCRRERRIRKKKEAACPK